MITQEKYEYFKNQSVIYTMFNINNNATSIIIDYDGETYDIRNNFFWLTREQFLNLKDIPDEIMNDFNKDLTYEPYAATWIKENYNSLNDTSKNLLNLYTELLKLTMSERLQKDKYYQLYRWDAGRQQIYQSFIKPNRKNKDLNYIKIYDEICEEKNKLDDELRDLAEEAECWWKVNIYEN